MFYPALVTGFLVLANSLAAQTIGETRQLLADDGASSDHFARSIALSGTRLVVGAPGDDDNGLDSGSAYLFDTTTGVQLAKLLPIGGTSSDAFGCSVGIDNATAIVGAEHDGDQGFNSGSAYLFDTATGLQSIKLFASDAGASDGFGADVAIRGTIAIIGAPLYDIPGETNAGCAYLFDTVTGLEIATLLPSDGKAFDEFGEAVALDSTLAIVGARFDDTSGTNTGAAYLFDLSTGLEVAKLLPEDGEDRDLFGCSVAIDGPTAVVGAIFRNETGADCGAVYLFDTATGKQTFKLLASDGQSFDLFGSSVSIRGTTVVVGAPLRDGDELSSGAAYIFSSETGKQLALLLPSKSLRGDNFGVSVATSGVAVVVGADMNDDTFTDAGTAFVIEPTLGTTVLNNGAGINPVVLTDGGKAPVLGQVWPGFVDTGNTGHAISTCVWFDGALPPGSLIIGIGEVIIDPLSDSHLVSTVFGTGMNDHNVLVPGDLNLIGRQYTVQAILYEGGPPVLLGNALDITVGLL